jgi:hypothetical protein
VTPVEKTMKLLDRFLSGCICLAISVALARLAPVPVISSSSSEAFVSSSGSAFARLLKAFFLAAAGQAAAAAARSPMNQLSICWHTMRAKCSGGVPGALATRSFSDGSNPPHRYPAK